MKKIVWKMSLVGWKKKTFEYLILVFERFIKARSLKKAFAAFLS